MRPSSGLRGLLGLVFIGYALKKIGDAVGEPKIFENFLFALVASLVGLVVGVLERAGVRFDLRSLRRSFGQSAHDGGDRYALVSVQLGHKTTRTTETHYASQKFNQAAQEMERVWTPNPAREVER